MATQNPNPPEAPPAREPYAATYSPARSNPFEKTPLLAAILSVFPGLGNIYNGLYLRGLAFSVLCFGIFLVGIVREEEVLIPAIAFFWLFNIIDAYRQATFINYGYVPAREQTPSFPEERGLAGGLILGGAIFLVGLYGLLTHLGLDLERVFDYWYVLFLGFGAWLIIHTLKSRRAEDGDEPSSGVLPAERAEEEAVEEEAA